MIPIITIKKGFTDLCLGSFQGGYRLYMDRIYYWDIIGFKDPVYFLGYGIPHISAKILCSS